MRRDFSKYLKKEGAEHLEAFIDGYLFALSSKKVFGEAFNIDGHLLEAYILGEIIFYDQKIEKDQQGKARIMANLLKGSEFIPHSDATVLFDGTTKGGMKESLHELAEKYRTADGKILTEDEILEMAAKFAAIHAGADTN